MTRLLLKLKSKDDTRYENEYHYSLQGLIYRLLKDSKYDIHDKHGSKFFTFSNIFPYYDLNKNDIRNLMISSPSEGFIDFIQQQLEYDRDIAVGHMRFRVEYADKLKPMINGGGFGLLTGTPILIRINNKNIRGQSNNICWKTDYPIDIFIKQLENNLVKRYNEFFGFDCGTENEQHNIFEKLKFKKEISTKIHMNSKRITVIATTWEFIFDQGANGHSKLIQFALDAGLGELNSMGFGFMNLKMGN